MFNLTKLFYLVLAIMFVLWQPFSLANSSDEYPNLSENKSSSENYEIVKLIDNSIRAVLFHEKSQQIIITTGSHLGRINGKGQLIDYFKTRRSYYPSGLSFSQDDYNDWIFTGQKSAKPYDSHIDARGYSEKQLFVLFEQAEIVEFSTNNRYERKGYAHLYSKGKATLVDISDKAERIDSRCDVYDRRWENIGWQDVCFEGYQQKTNMVFVDNLSDWGSSSQTDATDTQPPLTLVDFTREKYTVDEGIGLAVLGLFLPVITGHDSEMPNTYWYGDAYFQLKHKEEVLPFKLFADNEGEHVNHRNFSLYQPETPLFDETKLIVVNYRFDQLVEKEAKLNKYYEQDVGLYALRKKGQDSSAVIPHQVTRWQPAYSGETSSKPIYTTYSFFDRQLGRRHFQLSKQGNTKETFLRLPKTMSLDWHSKNKNEKFTLKISDTKAAVYLDASAKTKVSFAIGFDEEELHRCFALITDKLKKKNTNEVIKLEIQFNKITKGITQLNIGLASKDQFIELKDYSVMPIGNVKLKEKLEASYQKAYDDSSQLDGFLSQVKFLSKEPNYVEKYLAKVTYYTTKLVLHFNNDSTSYKASQKLINFYTEYVFPHINLLEKGKSTTTNHAIIVSQAIPVSIFLNDIDMQQLIFDTLLGQSFEISRSDSGILAFNLACFYALNKEKALMLTAIKRARELGKKAKQFLNDGDFKYYYQDDDFLRVIN